MVFKKIPGRFCVTVTYGSFGNSNANIVEFTTLTARRINSKSQIMSISSFVRGHVLLNPDTNATKDFSGWERLGQCMLQLCNFTDTGCDTHIPKINYARHCFLLVIITSNYDIIIIWVILYDLSI